MGEWAQTTPDDLHKWHSKGARGLRLNYFRSPAEDWPDLRSENVMGLMQIMKELGWHIEVYAKAAQWPELLPQLEATGVTMVIDHFGMPNGAPTQAESDAGFAALLERGRSNERMHVML